MNWTIHKIEGQPFVRIITEGDFNLDDHLKMIQDFISREFWKPGTNILLDHRNLEFGSADIDTLRSALLNYQKYKEQLKNSKIAILSNSLADYGRGRQLASLSSGKISAKIGSYLVEKEAIDWVAS